LEDESSKNMIVYDSFHEPFMEKFPGKFVKEGFDAMKDTKQFNFMEWRKWTARVQLPNYGETEFRIEQSSDTETIAFMIDNKKMENALYIDNIELIKQLIAIFNDALQILEYASKNSLYYVPKEE